MPQNDPKPDTCFLGEECDEASDAFGELVGAASGNGHNADDGRLSITRREFLVGSTALATDLARTERDVAVTDLNQSSQREPPAAPILLLPLRLEYRYIPATSEPLLLAETDPVWVNSGTGPPKGKSPLRFKTVVHREPEIWFRCYPDDPFYSIKPESPSEEEKAALARFNSALSTNASKCWYELEDANISAAWQEFVGTVGFYRALHLKRLQDGSVSDLSASQLLGLPDCICLYGITRSKRADSHSESNSTRALPQQAVQIVPLGKGNPIPRYTAYSPDCLRAGRWVSDFNTAETEGMGIRLSGDAAVKKALAAEWVIAVGLRKGDALGEVANFLSNAIAAGAIEFLPQGSPTNTSSRQSSAYRPWISDPVGALPSVTYFERVRDDCPTPNAGDAKTDADEFAKALGLDARLAYRVRNADLHGHAQAGNMSTALLPALTHFMDDLLAPKNITKGAFAEYMKQYAYARGPLPAVRFDHSPYGFLPISVPDDLEPPDKAPEPHKAVFRFVKEFCKATIDALDESGTSLPIIRPGAPDQGQVLRRIVQILPVSSRVDASDAPQDPHARRVRCPLVGSQPPEPTDSDEVDTETPLLSRLLGFASSLLGQDGDRIADFNAAVHNLENVPRPELELLLLEALDLLDHRIDAWQTSLATCRLTAQRAAGHSGLMIGYYGMLSQLKTESATSDTDGYVVTPSIAQATTAGLLRSAALRFASEDQPFQTNLSSRRVRKALKTLDSIRKGMPVNEVLGYHAERWLHDKRAHSLIYDLRTRFPVHRGAGAEATTYPLIDGQMLLNDAAFRKEHPKGRDSISELLDELMEERDAFCDLVVAESVHQLALGNMSRVSAWMQVLTGGMPPSEVEFVRIVRRQLELPADDN